MSDTFDVVSWGSIGAVRRTQSVLLDAQGQIVRRADGRAYGGRRARGVAVGARAARARRPTAIAVAIRDAARACWSIRCSSRGFAVFALNPKQLDRFRDRFTAAGAKDDRRDAHVLADALRTDRARVSARSSPTIRAIIQLRELCRMRRRTAGARNGRLANRLARAALSRPCARGSR